ncbi:recombinase family protein [Hymenobacter sublimis]|uniref:Recombinase family protein n=1 Tax=Hymenobacter sublimis TaxID=2933777 RepID=A0ABY4JC72_9BACT|nr:recombinase family protein [Hymenobacter sublimis]UPL50205.1 recombinase family protein [Hymenobacter sublimis]
MSVQRPALDELLGLLREGDTVLVAHFFRLGRRRDHVIHLFNSFYQRGIHFKALDLGINTTTSAGKFMFSIFASLTEYDREGILEKTKAGQQLAAAQGKHIGRPKGLYEQS